MAVPSNASIQAASLVHLASTSAAYGYLVLLLIPVLTTLGNILVILAVVGDKQLKKSVTNRYIGALAFSDLLVGVIPMPLAVYVKVNGEQWNLGVSMCKFYVACDVTSSTASILHLLVISADRYLAISWPAEYQRYARKAKITFAIVLVWLISITLSIPVVMGKSILDTDACWLDNPEYMIYSSLLSFYIPAGVLTLVYAKIFRKIRVRQGIRAMLKAGAGACASDVAPFRLPFVVVQEVSFDYQPSSAERRCSDASHDIVSPPVAAADLNAPAISFPSKSRSSANNRDGLGYYQPVREDEEGKGTGPARQSKTDVISKADGKSRTFPTALAREAETRLSLHDRYSGAEKRNCSRSLAPADLRRGNGSLTTRGLNLPESRIERHLGSRDEDGVRLLCRTASEKRLSGRMDRAVQTRHHRRPSLWYHHNCRHIGDCFVIDDNDDDDEDDDDDELDPRPKMYATTRRRLFSRALGSSVVSLKQASRIRKETRRTSSLEPKRTAAPAPADDQQLAVDPPAGVSVSTSVDYTFGARKRSLSEQADDEEDEVAAVYTLPGSLNKGRMGFNLKKLANRLTCALHRIKETQAVTKEKKATKLVALILGVFVISWLPFFTFNTMRGICLSASSSASDCEWLNSHIFFFTSWLGYANSSFNPILYGLVNQHFRRTYKRLLGWPLKRRN